MSCCSKVALEEVSNSQSAVTSSISGNSKSLGDHLLYLQFCMPKLVLILELRRAPPERYLLLDWHYSCDNSLILPQNATSSLHVAIRWFSGWIAVLSQALVNDE